MLRTECSILAVASGDKHIGSSSISMMGSLEISIILLEVMGWVSSVYLLGMLCVCFWHGFHVSLVVFSLGMYLFCLCKKQRKYWESSI